jgi:hypothetical protein
MINSLALVLSGLGVGGLLGAYAKALLDKQQFKYTKLFDYKEARYKAISVLIWAAIDPIESELANIRKHGYDDITTPGDLDRLLRLEYHNALIFASGDVIRAFRVFLSDKSVANWENMARVIKRDLYFDRKLL